MSKLTGPNQYYRPEGVPVTPYQKAAQEWDNRIGDARVQAKNWRYGFFGILVALIIMTAAVAYMALKTKVVPFVVQVDKLTGVVQAAGPAEQTKYTPSENEIKYFVSQLVSKSRSVPLDPVVLKKNIIDVYNYLRPSAAQAMDKMLQSDDPVKKIGKETVTVSISSIVALSKDSYQARWTEEKSGAEGASNGIVRMTGAFTIELVPPVKEADIFKNPLGLYVKQFSWSQDVTN